MTEPKRKCPDNAALNIRGEHFPCDMMDQMHESCFTHEGWPHANRAAEAIWTKDEYPNA